LTQGGSLQVTGASRSRGIVRRAAACFAMLALLLQLAATFGHAHPRDFAGAIDVSAVVAAYKVSAAKAAMSSPDKLAGDEDQCPICFSASLLAASSMPHAAQPVALRDVRGFNYTNARAAFELPASGKASFQSRAPPSA
jgi:hypothetical protein